MKHLIDDRDGFANLVLLCGVHHDVIDGDTSHYTLERLAEIKQLHEAAVLAGSDPQDRRQEDAEVRYAGIVDEWARRVDLDSWNGRMSRLASDGMIEHEYLSGLVETGFWLLNRVWPRQVEPLEQAFTNFRRVVDLWIALYGDSPPKSGISWLSTARTMK